MAAGEIGKSGETRLPTECVIGASNIARIVNLELAIASLRKDYAKLSDKIDDLKIMTHSSINKILGGLVVACILLVINLFTGG